MIYASPILILLSLNDARYLSTSHEAPAPSCPSGQFIGAPATGIVAQRKRQVHIGARMEPRGTETCGTPVLRLTGIWNCFLSAVFSDELLRNPAVASDKLLSISNYRSYEKGKEQGKVFHVIKALIRFLV
jgi:hypothetical protein